MPSVNIEENIQKLREKIEKSTQDLFRMQGMLQTFEGFKQGGLKTINLPNDPTDDEQNTIDKKSELEDMIENTIRE